MHSLTLRIFIQYSDFIFSKYSRHTLEIWPTKPIILTLSIKGSDLYQNKNLLNKFLHSEINKSYRAIIIIQYHILQRFF